MTRNEKLLCVIYAVVAIVALYATWVNNLAFMAEPENRNLGVMIEAIYVNHAAASATNDLLLLAIAACVFIGVEGHRLKVRYYWVYIILSGLTAMSFSFPLFLIARQMKIAQGRI